VEADARFVIEFDVAGPGGERRAGAHDDVVRAAQVVADLHVADDMEARVGAAVRCRRSESTVAPFMPLTLPRTSALLCVTWAW